MIFSINVQQSLSNQLLLTICVLIKKTIDWQTALATRGRETARGFRLSRRNYSLVRPNVSRN